MPNISLLKPGSILRDRSGRILDASSSVSLIISDSKKIIVDTGARGEEDKIIGALATNDLRPEDIEILINTHSHPDHIGNNHLFCKAELLAPSEGEIVASGVKAIETPGHTLDSISIIVDAEQMTVVAGDALPTFSNYIKEVPPAIHEDRALAVSSMRRIVRIGEIVIPGHDLPFSMLERKYVDLAN